MTYTIEDVFLALKDGTITLEVAIARLQSIHQDLEDRKSK